MGKVFLVAEVGQAHDGSLGILHSYIDAVSKTGIDAIKFQIHIAEAESSPQEPFRTNFSYEDKTRFDYWKRMSFTKEQWQEIKSHCENAGVEFMATPFSVAAVDLLESIGVNRYKVGSGDINNYLMLERIGQTKKPVILSSGMSSLNELSATVAFLKPFGNALTILQCTTSYPTAAEQLGLNVIPQLKEKFPEVPIGFSDHSGAVYPGIAAVALGASVLEFHIVFDKRMFGPDASSSLTIDEVGLLVEGVRMIERSLDSPVDKSDTTAFADLKRTFEKSLSLTRDLPKGHILSFTDLESTKPKGEGIAASQYRSVIGKKLNKDKLKHDFLKESDLID